MEEKTNNKELTDHKKHRRRKIWIILGIILGILIIIRLILPSILLRYANKTLAGLSEYTGHIDDIDLHLYRGAAVIKGITIRKIQKEKTKSDTIPFVKTKAIDFSIEWREIFKGAIVGEIEFIEPTLNIVSGRHKNEDVKKDSADFQTVMKKMVPLKINRLDITNGSIRYVDVNSDPKVDVAVTDIFLTARNLTNVVDKQKLLPAQLNMAANVYNGNFKLDVDFNPLIKQPTFKLVLDIKNINMVHLNDFLKAYGNFDVRQGSFSMYSEFAGKKGEFGGYVKPFIKDFKVTKWKKDETLGEKLWKTLVGTAMSILENPKTDAVATKVPINGRFNDPNINVLHSIGLILRNAFVQALRPAIDNSINLNKLQDDNPKTFIEKVFGKKDKEDKKDKEAKKEEKKEKKEERKEKKEEKKEKKSESKK